MVYILIKFTGLFMFCSIIVYLTDWEHVQETPIICTDNLTAVRNVSDKFLSVALDTSLIRNGQIHRINSRKFLHRAALLTPAFLRIGGSDADRLIFVKDGSQYDNELPHHDTSLSEQELYDAYRKDINNFTMTGSVWSSINKFSERSGLQLVFDLNVLLRNKENWETSNAQDLLLYSSHFKHDIVWQLGNEPNSFRHVFGTSITPSQLGKDFKELRRLLNQFSKYKRSMIIGPDITRPHHLGENPIHYLKDFLLSVGNSTINAVTWHQYYLNGRTATLQDFIDPNVFNILKRQILAVKEVVKKLLEPKFPIWLSETSSAYGGGAPGLSNTFVAGFLWLDKLGLAARFGIDIVVRQSLYQGYYALLDHTLNPFPDWWLSIIYKRLVGTTVIDIEQYLKGSGPLRLYAHCSSKEEAFSKGSVITLFGMNLQNSTSRFKICSSKSMESAYVSAYVLTGCPTLTTRFICLNGKPLLLNPDETLPELKPIIRSLQSIIYLPPHSLGFWTLHGIITHACPSSNSFGLTV